MDKAGWLDVWHLVAAIVSRQPPFTAIVMVIGAAFVAVMALEGVRTSLLAIWHAHRRGAAPAPVEEAPVALAAPVPLAVAPVEVPLEVPVSRSFSPRRVSNAAPAVLRKRKVLTVGARNFRSPRPKIRRHPMIGAREGAELPHYPADVPVLQHEGV
jgi:hypothetical protein